MRDLYIGIDESNHGKVPEIFVGVRSYDSYDAIENIPLLGKTRNHSNIGERVGTREYRFLVSPYKRGDKTLKTNILLSLTNPLIKEQSFDYLHLLIDGEIPKEVGIMTRTSLSHILKISKEKIIITSGPDYDRKFELVNIADQLANHFFRKKTLEDLTSHKCLVELVDSPFTSNPVRYS